jgi:hypothetical protein
MACNGCSVELFVTLFSPPKPCSGPVRFCPRSPTALVNDKTSQSNTVSLSYDQCPSDGPTISLPTISAGHGTWIPCGANPLPRANIGECSIVQSMRDGDFRCESSTVEECRSRAGGRSCGSPDAAPPIESAPGRRASSGCGLGRCRRAATSASVSDFGSGVVHATTRATSTGMVRQS